MESAAGHIEITFRCFMKFYRFITPVPAGTKPLQTIVPYPRPNLTNGAGT